MSESPKCCEDMKESIASVETGGDGFWVYTDGTLRFTIEERRILSGIKFCPWCGKAVKP